MYVSEMNRHHGSTQNLILVRSDLSTLPGVTTAPRGAGSKKQLGGHDGGLTRPACGDGRVGDFDGRQVGSSNAFIPIYDMTAATDHASMSKYACSFSM